MTLNQQIFKDQDLPLAVVVTRTSWDEPPRIRHQVTRQLTRFFNVLYISYFFENKQADSTEKISDRLTVYSPGIGLYISPRLYANDPVTHHLVNLYFKKKIVKFVDRFKSGKNILVNFIYDYYEIMDCPFFDYKIYICFDEFPKMQRRIKKDFWLKSWYQSTLFQYYENKVAKGANKCLATHYPLRDKLQKVNSNTELFLPGHEFTDTLKTKMRNSKSYPIRVAFMGYINYRILLDWLTEIIENKDMHLYLIGPLEKLSETIFSQYKNVKFVSPLEGEELQRKLSEMDVLIIPYNTEAFEMRALTASNKLFQYIAAGLPVVISDMPNYIKMEDGLIYKATDAKDFIKKIRQAYKEDCDELIALRQKIASENTWDKRGDWLYEIIKEAVPSLPESRDQ